MRQDKLFSRILLIFSIANVAVPAPAVVRQRHLDLTKAASEKRSQGSGNGETGDLPLDSSSGIPPPNSPPGDWAWFHRLSSEPEVPESSSAAANRIATQASGTSGLDDGASEYWTPESSFRTAPHDSPTHEWASSHGATSSHSSSMNEWAWLDNAGSPQPIPVAGNHITTQAWPDHSQGSPSVAASDSDFPGFLKDPRVRKVLAYSGFAGFLGGLVAVGYEWSANTVRFSSLSSLFCGRLTELQTF